MPPKMLVLALFLLGAPVSNGHEHAHEHHAATLGAVTILHAWTTPAAVGEDALVFFEVKNGGDPVALISGETGLAASVEVVGASMMADGTMGYQPIETLTIPPGSFAFDPAGLGLRLNDLNAALVEGEAFDVHLLMGAGEVEVTVEVQPAGAKAHSHAGHSH